VLLAGEWHIVPLHENELEETIKEYMPIKLLLKHAHMERVLFFGVTIIIVTPY